MRCRSYQSLRIPYDDSVFLRARYVSKILFYILFHHHICTLFFRYVTSFNFPLRNLSGVHVYTYILYWVCPCIHDRMTMRIVYSREFLLSFGEFEHCKKLPPDFDTPLLRSFSLVFYCLGLFPSGQWDFCLTIFVVASPTVSCRNYQRLCLRESRATTTHPGTTIWLGASGAIPTLLLVGTLEGGGTLSHLDQAVRMGSYPIVGLRHRVKLLFYLCNIFQ